MNIPESFEVGIGEGEYPVFFDYQPAEPEVGEPERVTVTSVLIDGMHVTSLLHGDALAELESELLQRVRDHVEWNSKGGRA